MYRAYDRHLYERAPAVPARKLTHPGPRTVVHPLLFCPPLPQDTRYMLVRREWPGVRNVLAVGRAQSAHETVMGYVLAVACIIIGWSLAYTARRDKQSRWLVLAGVVGGPAFGALVKFGL